MSLPNAPCYHNVSPVPAFLTPSFSLLPPPSPSLSYLSTFSPFHIAHDPAHTKQPICNPTTAESTGTFQIRTVKSTQGTPALSTPAPATAPTVPPTSSASNSAPPHPSGATATSTGAGPQGTQGPPLPAKDTARSGRPESGVSAGMAGLGIAG
jgi:hypothetical protein